MATIMIADILVEFDDVALRKMDLEGMQKTALDGADRTQKRSQPVNFENRENALFSAIFWSKYFAIERLGVINRHALDLEFG